MTLSRLSENLAMGATLILVHVVAGKLGLMLAFCACERDGRVAAYGHRPACVEWFLLTVACPCGVAFGRWVTPERRTLARCTSPR